MGAPRILPTVLALAVLGCVAPAQQGRILPEFLARQEGNTSGNYPFHYRQGRMQQIWEAAHLTKLSTALIVALGFRRDNTGTIGGYTIPAVTLEKVTGGLGYTSRTIASLSSKFAENRTGAQTVFFSGTLNLPFQPKMPSVGPWNIVVKATTPFIYRPAQGNLLMDARNDAARQGYSGYWIDAHELRSYATYWMRGMSGPMSDSRRYTFSVLSGSQGVPGGTVHFGSSTMSSKPSGIFFAGVSETRWGPLQLPLDLGAFGMPGNHLYTGIDAMAPLAVRQVSSTWWEARGTVRIPNDSRLGGGIFFLQSLLIDPKANKTGLVFTNAMKVELGGGQAFTRTVASNRIGSQTGYAGSPSSPGGPVVYFSGAL